MKKWLAVGALVVIVLLVAVPQYGGYRHRAQASEAVSLMAGARVPLLEYFTDNKKWPESLDKINVPTTGKYTRLVAITKGAGGNGELEITATMKPDVDSRVAGHSIRLFTRDFGTNWTCRPGTMPASNLPATCRD